MYWFEFIISAFVIILAGSRLTIFADRLSDQLNLGKALIGIVLLGLITSLPEAVSCFVAVRSLNAGDLAVGNLLGSNNFNPLLVVVLDLVYRKGSITDHIQTSASHKLSVYYVVLLTLAVIFDIVFPDLPHFGPVTIGGVAIVWIYVSGMRNLAKVSRIDASEAKGGVSGSVTHTVVHIFICTVFVVAAAIVLANAADKIAASTGLGRTFVGSIFLALVTSLPEMVVSLSALQMGSIDLAVGNIFGSNMSNIFILFLCSLVNPGGPLLYDVQPTHIITAVFSIAMVIVAIAGIHQNKKKVIAGLGWDAWVMSFLFLLGSSILFYLR